MAVQQTKIYGLEEVRIVFDEFGNEYVVCRGDERASEIAKEKAEKSRGSHWIIATAIRGFINK